MTLAQPQQKSSLETSEELLSVELFIVRFVHTDWSVFLWCYCLQYSSTR